MNKALLVVDIQPAYNSNCAFVAQKVAQRINNTVKPVVVMWVGEGLTSDSEESVRDYLRAHGARPGRLDTCAFIEKDYGFFRGWMDSGVSHDSIVTAGKALMSERSGCSSADLDLEALLGDIDLPMDPLYRPCFDEQKLQYISAFETCGGGSNECLAEIELWLRMQGKPFTRLDHLVYH